LNLTAYLKRRQHLVDASLERWIPGVDEFPPDLHQAMHYSLFAGGKRLRPILALAACEAVGGKVMNILPIACALELIHTYSLIHDDLPSMDDDDLRRGKPTSHKVFGEAIAILAGDALLTEAFHLLTRSDLMRKVPPKRKLSAISLIAKAASSFGMIGGQAVDILSEGKKINTSLLEYIHSHKTGALISASVCAGAVVGGGSADQVKALKKYGEKLGLAFQVLDDLLDVEGETEKLGKAVRKDQAKGKATYPALFGKEKARMKAVSLVKEALLSLRSLNRRADPLREIAQYILQRKN
jgi:geranylgeranyl diphosphate synthase, type II